MCGRFCLDSTSEVLVRFFATQGFVPFAPRYNIAPGRQVLAVRWGEDQREAAFFNWGLIPAWAKDRSIGAKLINARGETLSEKPSFRAAFKMRRCLIPATGFYEWKVEGTRKQPFLFRRCDREPFALAGLWERWIDKEDGQEVDSCSIITTAANSMVSEIHQRMPVLISTANFDEWLQGDSRPLKRLLESSEWPGFEFYAVSSCVNNSRNEGEECVKPLP